MKQALVTGYVFNAAAQTIDLSSISGFNVERLYAVIDITQNQIIYAAGLPAFGLASITGNIITLVFNTTAFSNTDKLVIIYDTVNTDIANAWVTMLTDGTHNQSYTTANEAKVSVTQPLPAGANNLGSLTNITGTISLPTNAAQETGGHLASVDAKLNSLGQKAMAASVPVVIASDQSAIPVSQSGSWTVSLSTEGIEIGKVDQGLSGSNAQAWWTQIGDTTHGPVAVKPASTAAIATDPSLVVALSPNSPLPAGANILGSVSQNGTWTVQQGTPPWSVSQSGAWTTGRTWNLTSGADSVAAVQSGTWNINNISGTVSLPTGASTAANQATIIADLASILANQTNGTQETQVTNFPSVQAVSQSGTWTVQQGTPPWSVSQSGTWNINNVSGTISLPTGASTSALQTTGNTSLASILAGLTSGTQLAQVVDAAGHVVTIKPASTASIATDTSLVTAFSPNSPLPTGANVIGAVTQSGTWTVSLATESIEIGKVDQGTAGSNAQAWWTQIGDTTHGPVAVKAASTAAIATDLSLVTAFSPNSPLPTGANVIGAVTQSGTWNIGTVTTVTTVAAVTAITNALPAGANTIGAVTQASGPWTQNITQFGGSAVVTGTGASGAGIPRVTVANDSNILATQSGTWNITNISGTISLPTGASTSALQTTGNTSLASILANQTNGTQTVAQAGTWNINNISGTISLPTGASTSALQTTGNTSLATIATNTTLLAQGSTTSGQSGQLMMGAVTTAAPSYTTAQTNMLSLTLAGGLRMDLASAGGTAISTGTGASGAGIPRVTVANDSNILATQSGTWTVQQGSAPWSVSQSGTWNITNISGTISLPTGAATSANQTNASQKSQIVDGSGNVIASTAVSAVNYLNVLNPSEGATAAAVPARTTQIGGSDGTNLRTLVTDTTGNLNIVGNVASAATDSGNPIKIGGLAKTAQPTAVTDGQRVNGLHDKLGRQVVVSGHIRDLVTNQTTTITNSTAETTIVSSVASTFNDLSSLVITNGTATQVTVTIKDATAGTTRAIFDLAPFGGMVFNPMVPWKQTAVNNNWTATLSVNTVTVHFFAISVQNI